MKSAGTYKLAFKTDSCTSVYSDNFNYIITANSIDELNEKMYIHIYPNPLNGKNLTINIPYTRIILTDLTGSKVWSSDAQGNAGSQVDLSSVAKGIYLINIESGSDVFMSKLIIQ